MGTRTRVLKLLIMILATTSGARSQNPGSKPLTLEEAINQALAKYPSVRVSMERQAAAQGGISLAKTAYLPALNSLWQANRATRNNIFGQLLPQSVIPSISGPVLPTTSGEGATGSAGGLLLSWEPVDFGYRSATVRAASANRDVSAAEVKLTRLDLSVAVTNLFLNLITAQQVTKAAQANVARREVFARAVHTLVDNELRPGADASRADAELAAARIALIQAETNERVSRAALATLVNVSPGALTIAGQSLLESPAETASFTDVNFHPLAQAQNARVNLAASQASILDRSYVPRFNLQSALSARGSGANNDGTFGGLSDGLTFERKNWALGLTVTFGVTDFFSIRARKQTAEANQRAESARYAQTLDDLNGEVTEAQARLDGARQIAENTPVELQAARDGERQARARYDAGLATVVEVAEAQSLLIRAEIDDSVARLNIWRGLAGLAAAHGDFSPFLDVLRISGRGH